MEFNFFGYLTLKLHSNRHSGYERYFRNEYARINTAATAESNPVSIHVHSVSELPRTQPGDLRRTVNVKRLFEFNYLIRNLHGERVEIHFQRHWLDRVYMNAIAVFLQAQVLEPVMYFKLLERNVLFMHAAGVSRNSRGYLFPAHGGTGKTSFSMALLANGFELLGDDLLFVAIDNGLVYPYPRPLHVFTYNINNLPGATIPLSYRLRIYLKNSVRFVLERLLKTEFLISTRVHADRIFPAAPFGAAVPYAKIFFLRKEGEPVEVVPITGTNRTALVNEIINSADLNDSLYQILDTPEELAKVKSLEARVISRLLDQMDTITYVNPRRFDDQGLKSFIHDFL